MNCKTVFISVSLIALAMAWLSTPLNAGTLKEGRLDFNVCKFGKSDYPRQAKGLIDDSFGRIAASIYDNGGSKDSEQQNPRCVGTYEIVGGQYRDHGVCTQIDADGDTWFMRYETGADLSGKWVAEGGSGKYDAMTSMGEYRPIGNVPGLVPNGFKSCNHYTGTYKLK